MCLCNIQIHSRKPAAKQYRLHSPGRLIDSWNPCYRQLYKVGAEDCYKDFSSHSFTSAHSSSWHSGGVGGLIAQALGDATNQLASPLLHRNTDLPSPPNHCPFALYCFNISLLTIRDRQPSTSRNLAPANNRQVRCCSTRSQCQTRGMISSSRTQVQAKMKTGEKLQPSRSESFLW